MAARAAVRCPMRPRRTHRASRVRAQPKQPSGLEHNAPGSGRPYRPPLRQNSEKIRIIPTNPVGADCISALPSQSNHRGRNISRPVPGGHIGRPYGRIPPRPCHPWAGRAALLAGGLRADVGIGPYERNDRPWHTIGVPGFGRLIAAPAKGRLRTRRGGLYGRPCRSSMSDAPPPNAPRIARPCPAKATIGAGTQRTRFRAAIQAAPTAEFRENPDHSNQSCRGGLHIRPAQPKQPPGPEHFAPGSGRPYRPPQRVEKVFSPRCAYFQTFEKV